MGKTEIIKENELFGSHEAELTRDILIKLINEGLSFNQITRVLRTAESEAWNISIAKPVELQIGSLKPRKSKPVEKYGEIDWDMKKAHTCISYHMQAYQQQDLKKEVADVTEACRHCVYNLECDYMWAGYIRSAIPEAKYRFTLCSDGKYLPEDIDP